MSDVFVSYASSDRPRAKMLGDELSGEGWSVWWDRTIPPGKTFDEVIEAELAAAGCVIVIWSLASVESSWVRAEAGEAMSRGVLIPVIMEPVDIPLVFRPIQAADLSDWNGEADHPGFRQLVAAIAATIQTTKTPEPGAAPPGEADRPGLADLREKVLKAKSADDLREVREQLAALLADEPGNSEANLLIKHVDGALAELLRRPAADSRESAGAPDAPTTATRRVANPAILAAAVAGIAVAGAWFAWESLSPDREQPETAPELTVTQPASRAGERAQREAEAERALAAKRTAEEQARREVEEAARRAEQAVAREAQAQREAEAERALVAKRTAEEQALREAEATRRRIEQEQARRQAAAERELAAEREAEQAKRIAEVRKAQERELQTRRLILDAEEVAAQGQFEEAAAKLQEAKSLAAPELLARVVESEARVRDLQSAVTASRPFRIAILPFYTTASCNLPRERELNRAVTTVIGERDRIELVFSFYSDAAHGAISENRAEIWKRGEPNAEIVVSIIRELEADGAYLAWIDCSDSPNIYDDQFDFHGYLIPVENGKVVQDKGILRNMRQATRKLFAKYEGDN
ncbi:MAG: TIR domain-containing protein [Gammaproteobacteria bacterium]|nr:TIR domain-containing protein [Gammaproteobacteria bacterium]